MVNVIVGTSRADTLGPDVERCCYMPVTVGGEPQDLDLGGVWADGSMRVVDVGAVERPGPLTVPDLAGGKPHPPPQLPHTAPLPPGAQAPDIPRRAVCQKTGPDVPDAR